MQNSNHEPVAVVSADAEVPSATTSKEDMPESSDLLSLISPIMLLAQRTFFSELQQLLPEHDGEWVAYRGDKRLAFGDDPDKLYQKFTEQGIPMDELVVYCVEPEASEYVFFLGPRFS